MGKLEKWWVFSYSKERTDDFSEEMYGATEVDQAMTQALGLARALMATYETLDKGIVKQLAPDGPLFCSTTDYQAAQQFIEEYGHE